MPLLKRLFQVHLELEGGLGHRVGEVVGHVDLRTHRLRIGEIKIGAS